MKTTGSSIASTFRVDDNEVVGGDGAEAEMKVLSKEKWA